MNVLLVTSWDTACGIAEHSSMLKEAVEATGSVDSIWPNSEMLDPSVFMKTPTSCEVLHLNYHAALHARWGVPEVRMAQARGMKVIITYHDTYAGTPEAPNSDRCKALHEVADAFVVHEPVEDLPGAIYWRQGVPALDRTVLNSGAWTQLAYPQQPIVGSVGFAFPWKGFELLCDAAREAGWDVLLIAHNATDVQVTDWQQRNAHVTVIREFLSAAEVIATLHNFCTATAFLYSCANTGQSAAILQGIGARRPVLASSVDHCRQFRSLDEATLGTTAIEWIEDLSVMGVAQALSEVATCAHAVCKLAEQESWERLGKKYAELYREVAAR